MASGLLGKSAPSANTWTLLYTVPSGKIASISINAVNASVSQAYVDIAASTSNTSAGAGIVTSEYLEYSTNLPVIGSSLERTGLVIDATNAPYLWVRTTAAGVAFQVYGYEE
jgi:hypothetical protein